MRRSALKAEGSTVEATLFRRLLRNMTTTPCFRCKVCKKCFTQQSSLQSHLLLHSDSRPFLCAICGKGFRQRSNLRVHEDRHHSKCTFVCRICAMAFASSSKHLYLKFTRYHSISTFLNSLLDGRLLQ